MSGLSKKFTLVMVFVFAVSVLFLVEPSTAPVTTPSNPSPAPEIVSVVAHDNPEWIPPTYSTNPYTGEITTIYSGYWRPNGTIEITIKNQPFNSHIDKNGNYISIYYTILVQYDRINFPWSQFDRPRYAGYQSDSDYTVIIFTYGGGKISSSSDHLGALSMGQVLYFRVQTVTGYFQGKWPYIDAVFEGEGSEWAEFTLTLPKSDNPSISTPIVPSSPNKSSTSNPIYSPQQKPSPQSTLIIVVIVATCIIAFLLSVIAYLHKQRKTNSPPNQT